MNLTRWVPAALAGIVCSATVVSGQRGTGAPAAPVADVATHAGLVEKSCVTCHNDKTKTAGLSLQGLSLAEVPAHGEVWEKVLRKVRSGEMPPPTVRTRPAPEASAAFTAFLERTLDSAAAARPNPGRAPVHRLNRAEYSNAIRDLLAVDVKPGAWLPVDDSGYGFDNIAAVLSTSPALLERYMTAARRISRLAVGDITLKPVEEIYDARRDPIKGTRNERHQRRSAVRFARRHFDSALLSRSMASTSSRFASPAPPIGENDPEIDPYQVRVPVKAGLHWVGVTSPRENLKAESEGPAPWRRRRRPRRRFPQVPYPVDLRLNGARVKRFDVPGGTPDVRQLVIGGPYDTSGRGIDRRAARRFSRANRRPRKKKPACARTILTALARRAFRRPVTRPTCSRCSRFTKRDGACPPELQRRRATSTPAFSARSKRCSSRPTSCSASSRDPARYTPGKAYPVSRSRARVAAVVFPLEQHSRRSAARPGRKGPAEKSCRAAAAGAAHARRPAVRCAHLELRRAVAASAQRRDGDARSRSSSRSTRRCARRS